MKAKRPTKEQVDARVVELLRIALDGAETWDIIDFVRSREKEADSPFYVDEAQGQKPLSYSQLRRYQKRAERRIAAAGIGDKAELLRQHVAKRRNLYAKAVSQGDMRAALAILADEAKLLGLYPNEEKSRKNGVPFVLVVKEELVEAPASPAPLTLEAQAHVGTDQREDVCAATAVPAV